MKTCSSCGRTLALSEFNWKDQARGKVQSSCKGCSRAYVRDHYRRNQAYYVRKAMSRNAVRHRTAANSVLAYLRDHPCVDCGECDPVVLDFDHSVRSEKRCDIATMLKDGWA
jgi:hypothetical protein